MTKHILYIALSVAAFTGVSCRKYVEVQQSGQRVLKYTSDYQALLNNVSVMEQSSYLPLMSEDDVDVNGDATLQTYLVNESANIYTWAADYYTVTQQDAGWNQLYNVIYVCNEIIANVMSSESGTTAQKQQILAEAQVQRAYTYLMLNNMYAPIYNTSTAGTTALAVPLQLTPDLFTDLTRPTLQTAYNQIIADLTAALPYLPSKGTNNIHPDKASAYGTLARTYLYMQDYTKATDYAAQSLAIRDSVLDLSPYASSLANYPKRPLNPEILLSKCSLRPGSYNYPLSSEVLSVLTTNDLRYSIFTRDGSALYPSFTGRGSYKYMATSDYYLSTSLTVPEMMLIQAEGLARTNQIDAALALVNKLRAKRFLAASYTALTATTSAEAIQVVLDEKRREFFDQGIRWFDQRRLSQEAALAQTETRIFKGATYTLAPGSNRYVYPIPPYNINLSPEIKQNDR